MKRLMSYLSGGFHPGTGEGTPLKNPTTEAELARCSSEGLDLGSALRFAREEGGRAVREATFAERGRWLAAMASAIHARRDALIQLAIENGGNTRGDAKFDIDGATATLTHYAELGQALGQKHRFHDGEVAALSRNPRWVGGHVWTSRRGVALHVNAFNFPAWNAMEKAAAALLSGIPVLTKPAVSTALVTHAIVEGIIEEGVLPKGALSLLCGSVRDLLDHVEAQDVIAFTGSAATGEKIRAHPRVVAQSVRVNIEADSLNAAVLGLDAVAGSDAYDMFLRELVREVTQKAGQKCTATRRVFVPSDRLGEIERDLVERLQEVSVGHPADAQVRMGPLATAEQRDQVLAGIRELGGRVATGGGRGKLVGVSGEAGYFVAPTLLVCDDAKGARAVHAREVFGPVTTLMPYSGTADEAGALVRMGGGSLVASVYSDDERFCDAMLAEIGCATGRVYFGGEKVAEHAYGPGTVLAGLIHGGPGRAGGGEELGGRRGLEHYMQRSAVQGFKPAIERMLDVPHTHTKDHHA